MMWRRKFKSQSYGRPILKHIKLPIYEADGNLPNLETAKEDIEMLTNLIQKLERMEE